MFIVVRAKKVLGILCLTILLIGGIIITGNRTLVPVFSRTASETMQTCYIIDAGHGGEDGGAVSSEGVIESDINLAIAQRTEQLMAFLGKSTAMTRSDEQAVYSDGAVTLREKKRSDLENRAAMINGYEDAVLISIHQNSLPSSPSVHGAQVFYNGIDGAEILAEHVQQSLNQSVNIGNEKTKKQIDSSIYLMRQVNCPAILVECGFLSNSEETKELQDGGYQTKLAMIIAAGVLNHENGAIAYESE